MSANQQYISTTIEIHSIIPQLTQESYILFGNISEVFRSPLHLARYPSTFPRCFRAQAAKAIKPYYTRVEFQWRNGYGARWTWKREPKGGCEESDRSMGTYVKLAGRTARWRAETRWEEREGWERQKERKRGRKGAGAVERERGKRTAGLPGGETTPNVNTNYSPCASVASAAALHPTDWHCQSRRPFWINVDDGASSEHVIRNGLLQGPNLALPSIAMYENV